MCPHIDAFSGPLGCVMCLGGMAGCCLSRTGASSSPDVWLPTKPIMNPHANSTRTKTTSVREHEAFFCLARGIFAPAAWGARRDLGLDNRPCETQGCSGWRAKAVSACADGVCSLQTRSAADEGQSVRLGDYIAR